MNSPKWIAVTFSLVMLAGLFAQAQTFTTLYQFTGPGGANPAAGVIQDKQGNLYGTTVFGGSANEGVVYKLSSTENVVHSFTGTTSDGSFPNTPVTLDSKGNLYGTAVEGGTNGGGVVFKIDTNGKETILYNFAGGTTDGCAPFQGLIMDKAGTLYGTTASCGAANNGTIFRLTSKGKEKILHSFAGVPSDGASPQFGYLLMDAKGTLYGVTTGGGKADFGVVYKLTKTGKFSILHSFAGGTNDGCTPFGTVAMDKAGNLYGTTEQCGASSNGAVWKVPKRGKEALKYSFAGGASDGQFPIAGVTLDPQGKMYGVTGNGGTSNDGIIYTLSKAGVLAILHSFDGSDGAHPWGEVLRNGNGALYGSTNVGGASSFGTVWAFK